MILRFVGVFLFGVDRFEACRMSGFMSSASPAAHSHIVSCW